MVSFLTLNNAFISLRRRPRLIKVRMDKQRFLYYVCLMPSLEYFLEVSLKDPYMSIQRLANLKELLIL